MVHLFWYVYSQSQYYNIERWNKDAILCHLQYKTFSGIHFDTLFFFYKNTYFGVCSLS